MKLLEYLLAQGLAPDERTARGLIMRGDVLVADRPVLSPHHVVKTGQPVRLRASAGDDVSRGALKLRPVAERAGFDCAGRICLDLGVATGGFTQVLLERGAARVYAVDVAYGTVALSIRNDSRVVLLERTNARFLNQRLVPEAIERTVGDLSFIGWSAVLPAVRPLLAPGAELLLLVKPQFELAAAGGEAALVGGVAVDSVMIGSCLRNLYNTWVNHDLSPRAVFPAAIKGAKGNQEYFVHLEAGGTPAARASYEQMLKTAQEEVQS